ncbi:uncharacterized protein LOC108588872 isoform X1 [Callithrix jacchus]
MPGSDFSLLTPPTPSTLCCRPLRQTPARRETRVFAVPEGPHPFPVLTCDLARGKGRSIPARNLPLASPSLVQFSSAGLCDAEPPAAEQTPERSSGTHTQPGGTDPRGARGRGREGTRASAEAGVTGVGGGRASRPHAPLSSPRRRHLAQVGDPSFPRLLCVGEGVRLRVGAWSAGRGR